MLNLSNRNLLVVDIETTGTNPFRNDALAVGLVPLSKPQLCKQIFVSHSALEWNPFARKNFDKFEREWRLKAITPPLACDAIEEFVANVFDGQEVTLIGHNIGFDVAFLRKLAFQGGRAQLNGISHRAIDTHTLLYLLSLEGKIPVEATSSDGALRYFGIELIAAQRHTALGDAMATRELFLRIIEILTEGQLHSLSV